MVSYYRHQYNRDSSRAVAVAIAYRLFQWQRYVSLLPTDWNILEEDGILNATQMDTIAKKLEDFLLKKEAVPARDALTLWEKERWNRFMLSRGWLSATGEEAVSYIKAGNPRPGLNIARLHPCLIPFDGLEALEKTLYDEFSMEKNFRDSDKSSITATHLLIQSQSLEPALEKDR